ncbi:hypothetical protein B0H15DRAFT_563082 [Mycena belliarum]|uniref:Uncharacterized protein n=1 Tax=Mycena belliarum TaxID=1033014 RepID=A0AAD6XKZ2_9AGAR|nr:hypothetical protein B0H15DRAFT_563082 [Mycena belliae]
MWSRAGTPAIIPNVSCFPLCSHSDVLGEPIRLGLPQPSTPLLLALLLSFSPPYGLRSGDPVSSAEHLRTARAFAAIDPESGWPAAMKRYKRLQAVDKYSVAGHPDHERWTRLEQYDANDTFLVDAAHGAEGFGTVGRFASPIAGYAQMAPQTLRTRRAPPGQKVFIVD